MDDLDAIADGIRVRFELVDDAREQAIHRSRDLIRICARSIRAMHREEWDSAESQLEDARHSSRELIACCDQFPSIYNAGYTQDALKEYVEAHLTYALMRQLPLKSPSELGVAGSTWLNGLSEAATELRRRILDIIRHGHSDEAERLLDLMDEIYSLLVTFDFHDTITRGLRRRTDTVRAVLERTRGDVTTSLRQAQLESALSRVENQIE
ncbi:MAG: haloacid dehalogenase [Anaerolineae bacterium]|nr:haloacid dehalogenase [Anaerolineae bacterium]MCO5186598.1 haloacid dehalogenase [Anaerolineae bacterium]MCO5194089.1 haloacid dehalogenase [Anaerolineae bacterium]MCO5198899.1 haloacid dehalogenase [Anaerolineae bacterium]MCO5205980.1 haloacid dehalogenase [Anaerolineae bacterium]